MKYKLTEEGIWKGEKTQATVFVCFQFKQFKHLCFAFLYRFADIHNK